MRDPESHDYSLRSTLAGVFTVEADGILIRSVLRRHYQGRKPMRFQRTLLLAAFMLGTTLRGQQPNMMPLPAEIKPSEGRLVIDGSFHVGLTGYQETRLQRAADRFLVHLSAETGIPLADHLESDASQGDAGH